MKRIVSFLLVALIAVSFSACSQNNNNANDTGTVSVASENKIDLSKYDISNDIYDDVFNTIDKYYSDAYQQELNELYAGYGKANYDNSKVATDRKKMKEKIKNDFSSIYAKCTTNNEKQLTTFGYNLSFLIDMNGSIHSMKYNADGNTEKALNKEEDIKKYYELVHSDPSTENIDDFCLYITKGNLFEYVTSLPSSKLTEKELSVMLSGYLKVFNLGISTVTTCITERNMTSMYDSYSTTSDSLDSILELLKDNPNLASSFTSSDIDEIQSLLDGSVETCRHFADSYGNGSDDASDYLDEFIDQLTKLSEFTDEVSKNVEKYS